MTSRRIVFAVFPGFQILDLTGPHEVFTQAGRLVGDPACTVVDTVAAAPGPVTSGGGGLSVSPTLTTGQAAGPVDTLVAGGGGVHQAAEDREFVGWFAATSRRARRTASVCAGAFLRGAAGLLDGSRAVTHRPRRDDLAALEDLRLHRLAAARRGGTAEGP